MTAKARIEAEISRIYYDRWLEPVEKQEQIRELEKKLKLLKERCEG